MKNKKSAIIIAVIILLAAAIIAVPELRNSLLTEKESQKANKSFFSEPVINEEPETSNISGAAATKYEPVYPVNISGEDIKQPVSLHNYVPEEYRDTYYILLSGLKNYEKDIVFTSPVDSDIFFRSLIYVRDLNPELFFIDWGLYNYKAGDDGEVFEVNFTFLYDDIPSKVSLLENKISSIVGEANKYPNLFERELFIHDYLVNNTTYLIDGADTGSAYGTIINHQARCEGYARAFQLLMLRVGVPTFSIIGTAENERHMWNAVNLYGKYYFVDVTFDDNSAEKQITLYGESEIGHSCFNIPDEIISKTHITSDSSSRDKYGAYQNLILPECNSYDYNYYRIRGLMAQNSGQFKYILEKNASEKHASVFFIGEMPSQEKLQSDFKDFFNDIYNSKGYSVYYTPDSSPVFKRNVYEIRWTVE